MEALKDLLSPIVENSGGLQDTLVRFNCKRFHSLQLLSPEIGSYWGHCRNCAESLDVGLERFRRLCVINCLISENDQDHIGLSSFLPHCALQLS